MQMQIKIKLQHLEEQSTQRFVVCDSPKMHVDIFIPKNKIDGAEDGDKVLVQIKDCREKADSPFGKIIQVLGLCNGLL